jgi:tRNA threonylcarbamoyladenosine biosynthesis protein TsaB
MKILALEFSTSRRSVAAWEADSTAEPVSRFVASPGHTEAFQMASGVLEALGWTPALLDRIVVGLGPGSYTGIRLAISIAQGWGLAHSHLTLAGQNSIELIARTAALAGRRGGARVLVDAHRGEACAQCFRLDSSTEVTPMGGMALLPWSSMAATPEMTDLGPDLEGVMPAALPCYPEAALLARLAPRLAPLPAERLEPVYLRPVQFQKAPPPRVVDLREDGPRSLPDPLQ